MAIALRGTVAGVSTSTNIVLDLTNLTPPGGGSAVAAQAGDIVLVWGGRAGAVNDDVTMNTAGYAELADLYANDVNDANAGLFWKAMGGTPDTQASIAVTGTSVNGASAIAAVFSGVDTTTPEDTATTTDSGISGSLADPPAITPVTAGALIAGFYLAAGGTSPTGPTAPANMTDFVSINSVGSTRRSQAGVALKTGWTSGAFDPDAWSGTVNGVDDSWVAATVALRPASGGGQTITGALYQDGDTFGAGAIATTYAITGAVFSDGDSFGAGTIAATYTITGTLYSDGDTFGAGVISQDGVQAIIGATYADADSFGSATLSTTYTIAGALYSSSSVFGSGSLLSLFTIGGVNFDDADVFGLGVVAATYTILGQSYSDADAFGSGVIAGGSTAQRRWAYPGDQSGGALTRTMNSGTIGRG